MQLAWARCGPRSGAALLGALLLALALAMPWQSLTARRGDPSWTFPRRFLEVVEAQLPELPQGAVFVLVYGGEGRAGRRAMNRFRSRTVGGTPLVRAAYYDLEPRMRFVDAAQGAAAVAPCDGCIYMDLLPDLGVALVDEEVAASHRAGDSTDDHSERR